MAQINPDELTTLRISGSCKDRVRLRNSSTVSLRASTPRNFFNPLNLFN